jgi:hypothetical protein
LRNFIVRDKPHLPVSATAMAAATAVESAATTTAVITATATAAAAVSATAITARYPAASVSATGVGMSAAYVAASRVAAAIAVSATEPVATAIAVPTAISISAPGPAPAVPAPPVPGSGADEDAAIEPARSVKTVGRASVRVIGVVAPLAILGTVIIAIIPRVYYRRADADSNSDLGARRNCGERQNYKRSQHNQPQLLHDILLVPPALPCPAGLRSCLRFEHFPAFVI